MTQDKTRSQNDSVFKESSVTTDIMDRYSNFSDLSCWIRRDSLHRMSERTLNMSVYNQSAIKPYCGGGDSFKPTCVVRTTGPTGRSASVGGLRVKKTEPDGSIDTDTETSPPKSVGSPSLSWELEQLNVVQWKFLEKQNLTHTTEFLSLTMVFTIVFTID